jgi:lipopolysaccharide export system permease protein
MDHRDDVSRLSPGSFNESNSTDRVFFVEAVEGNTDLVKNVFVSSMQHQRLGVIATASGRTEVAANGDRFLVLENGRRYEGEPGSPEYRIMEFDRYAFRIEAKDTGGRDVSPRAKPVWDLVSSATPTHLAELLWRIGVPLTALNLSLLAIPLAFMNPRAGRGSNLIIALLSYMIYNNFLSVSQAWVAQSKMPFWIGVGAVHLIMFAILLAFFAFRQNPLRLRGWRWS